MVSTKKKTGRRKKNRTTGRRKTTTRKTTKKRTTTTSLNKLTPEVRQLAVYHNPFARTTKQPKIPDGKITESLGFQTQAVREFKFAPAANGVLDLLLYPGQDAGLIAVGTLDSVNAFSANAAQVVGYTGSSGIDWSGFDGTANGLVTFKEKYSLWRIVSQGLKLSLLNPAEQDDGWFESIRVVPSMETDQYSLFTKDTGYGDRVNHGTVCPQELLNQMRTANLVNERSYSTGLLRDLKDMQFNLKGTLDHHDFRQQSENAYLYQADWTGYDAVNAHLPANDGRPNVADFVNQFIDPGYDMIYIRIHGRSDSNTRLHVNVVSNQEIFFQNSERENRFHTGTVNIGSSAMSSHIQASKGDGSSANVIIP
jgi:hypothetical protein